MVEAVFRSGGSLDGYNGHEQRRNKRKKKEYLIDTFPESEARDLITWEELMNQRIVLERIKSLEDCGCKAAAYLRQTVRQTVHYINVVVPDDIIISKRPGPVVDILA